MTAWWGGVHPDPVINQAMALGASQDPQELAMARDLIAGLDPHDVIVEIGCDRGGTLYCWRSLAERVYGITIADNSYETGGSGQPLVDYGAQMRMGDSHDGLSRLWLVGKLAGSPVDALVIDGDHSEAGVLADLADYGPMVRPGGVILLHDIRSDSDHRAQVHKVWPYLADQYESSQLCNREGGPGWGVIHVREGDEFGGDRGGA